MSVQKLPIEILPQVRSDIKSILKYTTLKWGKQQRATYKKLIHTCISSLATNPQPRNAGDQAVPGYYRRHLGRKSRHYVFYKVLEDRVQIVRILDDRMDFERHLSSENDNGEQD